MRARHYCSLLLLYYTRVVQHQPRPGDALFGSGTCSLHSCHAHMKTQLLDSVAAEASRCRLQEASAPPKMKDELTRHLVACSPGLGMGTQQAAAELQSQSLHLQPIGAIEVRGLETEHDDLHALYSNADRRLVGIPDECIPEQSLRGTQLRATVHVGCSC